MRKFRKKESQLFKSEGKNFIPNNYYACIINLAEGLQKITALIVIFASRLK